MLDLSSLDPAQISARIKAARELRGISQTQLGAFFEEDGLNKSDPGRIERMSASVPFRRAHLDALCRHLRVPERWFTEENVDAIVGYGGAEEALDQLALLAGRQEALQQQMAEVIGLLTDKPEAKASLADTIAQVLEEAMTQRAREVGLRGKRRPQRHQDEEQPHAA
jgi:transcriptional regulator with XRE-family HTH domain